MHRWSTRVLIIIIALCAECLFYTAGNISLRNTYGSTSTSASDTPICVIIHDYRAARSSADYAMGHPEYYPYTAMHAGV